MAVSDFSKEQQQGLGKFQAISDCSCSIDKKETYWKKVSWQNESQPN